jgi:hypothetical protein
MTRQIKAAVKRAGREVRGRILRLHLAFAAMAAFLHGVGLPSSAWAGLNLYIVSQNNVSGTSPASDTNTLMSVLYNIPQNAGVFNATSIGPGPTAEIRGLAYVRGVMYGITAQGYLVTVNLSTGATTNLASQPLLSTPFDTTFNEWSGLAANGTTLYAVNAGNNALVGITIGSWTAQLLGTTNFLGNPIQILGLAFDSTTGVLYGSDRTNDDIVTISTSTGDVSFPFTSSTAGVSNLQEIAFGPDGTLYAVFDHVASSDNAGLATINLTTGQATQIGELPFQIDFNGCTGCGNATYGAGGIAFGADALIEVCKSFSGASPAPGSLPGPPRPPAAFTSPAFTNFPNNSITVPVGECSGPIAVNDGQVTITETTAAPVPKQPPVALSAVVAYGYDPTTSVLENRLVSLDLANASATVNAVTGDLSFETVATFTNQVLTGSLKICKVAGANVAVGAMFGFTAEILSGRPGAPFTQRYTIPAGPASEGGYCVIDSTTFPVGAEVSVSEIQSGYTTTSVVSPAGTTGGGNITITIGTGFTEVTFTNSH